jgi:hypothetical protein
MVVRRESPIEDRRRSARRVLVAEWDAGTSGDSETRSGGRNVSSVVSSGSSKSVRSSRRSGSVEGWGE